MPLTDDDIVQAARAHRVSPEAVKAVVYVETPAPHVGDYLPGMPLILFERHKFYDFTGNFLASVEAPDLAQEKAGGYAKGKTWQERQAGEHAKLARARALFEGQVEEAALKSVSMGLFQIRGFNHALIGQPTPHAMWERYQILDDRLDLEDFFRFATSARLMDKLRALDWAAFARGYNGPAYARNAYDVKLAAFHKRFVREGLFAPVEHPGCKAATGFPDFSQLVAA